MAVYNQGDRVRCSVEFTDDADNPADPTTITFSMILGVIPIATYVYGINAELVRARDDAGNPIPGSFYVDWDTTPFAGSHIYVFIGTGTVQRTQVGAFSVEPIP
jgi:hypothetical protein